MIWDDKRTKITVMLLLAAGIFLRFYFYFGHVYSDDAYYDYLAYTLYNGNFGADYLGYPVCLVRIGQTWLTSLSFILFGTNKTATTVFPMIFSVINMVLSYRLVKTVTRSEMTALLVLLFTVFYPTEILFASIAFTDLFSTVLVNSGILMLFVADRDKKWLYASLSGLLFGLSVLFKINVFYTGILLTGLLVYQLFYKRTFNKYIFISISVLGTGIVLEGLIYLLINGDFFYRLTVMNSLSGFSSNDFITKGFVRDLTDNISAVFLRRTMLFIPLLAVIQLVIYRKYRKNRIVVYWFSGLLILYLFFSMSLTSYHPMPIRFTWYLFPLFLPAMVLATKFFTEMKKKWMLISLTAYIVFSIIMTAHFREYFDMESIEGFEQFIRTNCDKQIYTDHFTKYSIDLIDGYKEPSRVKRLNYQTENIIPSGSLVVFHTGHISEINKQGFSYPEQKFYSSEEFEEADKFGSFIIYRKK